MDINKYISKKTLIYICIIIVILIIFRILYNTFDVESFAINNGDAIDLLTKIKSRDAQNGINLNSSDLEMQIFSWSNYAYNLNNPLNTIKPIAFYKPIITINNNIYSKLGDIVSINPDYSLPSENQFTLLIKRNTSDIKLPLSFDLVVNSRSSSSSNSSSSSSSTSSANTNSTYLQYINGLSNDILINISKNLSPCSSAIDNLNTLIQNNLKQLNTNFKDMVNTNASITLANKKISIIRLLNTIDPKNNIQNDLSTNLPDGNNSLLNSIIMLDKEIENIIEGFSNEDFSNEDFSNDYTDFLPNINNSLSTSINSKPTQNPLSNNNSINYEIKSDSILILPAGIQGYITYSDSNDNISIIDISIPANLDSFKEKNNIINNLPLKPYNNISSDNIVINTYPKTKTSLFSYIPIKEIITYIKTLCIDIQNIYNQSNISNLLLYLKLAPSIPMIISLITITDMYLNNTNITNLKLKDFFNDLDKANIKTDDGSNLLGLVLYTIKNMTLSYNLTYLSFKPSDIGIISNNNMQVTITKFNNDIVSNIPDSNYNILSSTEIIPLISNIVPNINSFSSFITNNTGIDGSLGNSNSLPPICIYNPIAPTGYVSLGHVFCNSVSDLQKIIDARNIACVPLHCVKEIRNWVVNDKIFEYTNNNIYWAIYLNPYTGTFISTNTSGQLPSGKVCKVVACVTKNNSVDKLKKADDCIRKYYNINKQANMNSPISSKLVSDQEEVFYLNKIKSQSDSITRLQNRSQQLQTNIDKATIINREMNKNKLQEYIDTQKRNINNIMQKLIDDKNKIQTNINVPLNTLNEIINMINNLPQDQQNTIINLLDSNNVITKPQLNQIINSCPQYDLSGLVTKQMASDVCYGCDNPM